MRGREGGREGEGDWGTWGGGGGRGEGQSEEAQTTASHSANDIPDTGPRD